MSPEETRPGEEYRRAAKLFLEAIRPIVDRLRIVVVVPDFRAAEIVSRGVVCRQYDYLGVALGLAREDRGWAILPLVRPAIEELIWLSAVADMDESDRDGAIAGMSVLGAFNDVAAQVAFAGQDFARTSGLDAVSRDLEQGQGRAEADAASALETIGLRMRNGRVPSVRQVAKRGGRLALYDFLYHATSTAVHFRPEQIMRAIWGSQEEMQFDLAAVETARAAFGLFWCLWVARETLQTALPLCGDVDLPEPPVSALEEMEALLQRVGQPQFIYAEEFNRKPPSRKPVRDAIRSV